MSDELRIRVPYVPPVNMNINAHTHWRRKHPEEQNAHEMAFMAARSHLAQSPFTVPDHPVLVAVIHWPKGRKRRDPDNALSSAKRLTDGVCKALGVDDRVFMTSMAFQRRAPKGRDGFTDIIIRPATVEERRLAA